MIDGSTNVFEYTYDSTGRLTQVEKNSSVVSTYAYDDNNNRTGGSVYGTSTTGVYDAQDRMTDYNIFDYTYNANGDLETKTNTLTTNVWTYSYDEFGNLLSVELPNTDVISYEIDGFNRRVGRKLNGNVTRRYLYADQLRIIGEVDDTGALIRRYVYASKPNIPDYFIEGGNEYRIYSDHLGSPRLIVKVSDGTIMQKMEHDEFGRVVMDTNPGYTPFGFAGGLYDSATGLVRFGARDYDAETGRWTSKDPILFAGGEANLYGYVMMDPVNMIDSSGLIPDSTLTCPSGQTCLPQICYDLPASCGLPPYEDEVPLRPLPRNRNYPPSTVPLGPIIPLPPGIKSPPSPGGGGGGSSGGPAPSPGLCQ